MSQGTQPSMLRSYQHHLKGAQGMLTLSTLKLLSLSSEMGIRYPRTLSRSWMNLKTREEKGEDAV